MTDNELYKKDLYTRKVKYLINEIYEYDISKANISILLQYGYINQDQFNWYLRLPKPERERLIGLLQKDPKVSKMISNGFRESRKALINANHLTEDDIVSIKKDAFYVLKPLQYTDFGNIHFTYRNKYNMYIYCRGIEIYYGINTIDNTGDILDIKGISDDKLKLHENYLSFISFILKLIVTDRTELALQSILEFIQSYDTRTLDLSYYREFNATSAYHIGSYGVMFLEEEYKNVLNISYNQSFNRELFSIIMSIHYKR